MAASFWHRLRVGTAIERWWSQICKFELALVGLIGLAGFLGGISFVIGGNFYAIRLEISPISALVHMWLLLIGVQSAFWLIVLFYMVKWTAFLLPKGANARGDLLARVVLPTFVALTTVVVLLGLAWWANKSSWWPPSTLYGVHIGNLPGFTMIGTLIAAIVVSGMFVVSWRMAIDVDNSKDEVIDVDDYLTLYRFLDLFLLLAALMLGLGVLATAFLREAYNVSPGLSVFPDMQTRFPGAHPSEHDLPAMSVITYGTLFSVFLALYYGACRMQFLAQGMRLRDALAGPPPKDGSEVPNWAATRASLSDLLRLRLHGLPAFGESFAVAIPFVTSIIATVLGST